MNDLLRRGEKLIVYLEGNLRSLHGKTGLAILRYSAAEVAAVLDSEFAGQSLGAIGGIAREVPIVATLAEAVGLGGQVLLIGLATSGGVLAGEHRQVIVNAIHTGLSVVNGLHEHLAPQFPDLAPGQEIWDVRKPNPKSFVVGFGRALKLPNKRILTVGTDMAIGKMSACLELNALARSRGLRSKFLATGQAGIMISGDGIPLDAIPVDFAAGAVEQAVLEYSGSDCDLLFVEGQGSSLNPASTATMPLLRGSQATHLVLVHKADQTHVKGNSQFPIPPLQEVAKHYEDISRGAGVFPGARVVGIALNTSVLNEEEAHRYIADTAAQTGLPCVDAVRFGSRELLDAILIG